MSTLLLGLHIAVAFFLILVVLLQSGKGANIGAAFGGSSQTVFGSRGPASFLGKITTAAAVIFMLTSLTLSVVSSKTSKTTVIDDLPQQVLPDVPPMEEIDPNAIDPFRNIPTQFGDEGDVGDVSQGTPSE